jgi:predicted RNase H-like nuclease (RuvC/YqgF family)
MAADNIDLVFLGQQVQKLQVDMRDLRTDVRDLRSKQLRLEGDVASLRTSMELGLEVVSDRIERQTNRIDNLESETRKGFAAVDVQLKQMAQTAATNLEILLAAVKR